ncbi:hypothetical protein FOPE_10907 [Fonsecaea pedrosoi]|nr:hypothetical protein FOPE_10907 [Fonsecaea pedrosoi]
MIGDKLASRYGLKFTCGEMVVLMDTETSEKFRPNLLISTKYLDKGLGGQVRHKSACMSLFESIACFSALKMPVGKTVYTRTVELKTEPKLRSAYLIIDG